MHPQLQRALAPVLHDLLATTGIAPARIDGSDWAGSPDSASAMLCNHDGSATGGYVSLGAALVDQVVQVTDQVHEWAVEELWGSAPTNWPGCPRHPVTHPLEVRKADEAAWWTCPRDGTAVAEVGILG